MKKALAVLLAAVMCCTLLSACGQPETTDPTEGTEGTHRDQCRRPGLRGGGRQRR